MLRSLVLILLVVNAAFFAWSQGWLNSMVGVKPDAQRDPQRLQQQVRPELLVLLRHTDPANTEPVASAATSASGASSSPAPQALAPLASPSLPASLPASSASTVGQAQASPEASSAPASSPNALACVEAGPFTEAEAKQWQTRVQPLLPAQASRVDAVSVPGVWMVFMGPYPDEEQLHRKEGELRRMKGIAFDTVHGLPGFSPGLVLGRFKTRDEADTRLDALKLRGIRTARVVAERQPGTVQLLRVPQASSAQQAALAKLELPKGKAFTPCR